MKLIVKKENQNFVIEGQEQTNEYSFGIEANGIKTKEDIQEIIHQCRLVENQLTDESGHFNVSDTHKIGNASFDTIEIRTKVSL